MNQSNDVETTSGKIVLGFGKYLVGDFQESLRILDGAGGKINLETPRSGFELYDLTLRVLGNAVRGKYLSFGLFFFEEDHPLTRSQNIVPY